MNTITKILVLAFVITLSPHAFAQKQATISYPPRSKAGGINSSLNNVLASLIPQFQKKGQLTEKEALVLTDKTNKMKAELEAQYRKGGSTFPVPFYDSMEKRVVKLRMEVYEKAFGPKGDEVPVVAAPVKPAKELTEEEKRNKFRSIANALSSKPKSATGASVRPAY